MDLQQEKPEEIKGKRIYGGVDIGSWPAPLKHSTTEDIIISEYDPQDLVAKTSLSWELHPPKDNYDWEDTPLGA